MLSLSLHRQQEDSEAATCSYLSASHCSFKLFSMLLVQTVNTAFIAMY